MENFIVQLSQTKGYSDELKSFLLEIIPTMVSYYGEEYEMIIMEALVSSDIYQCNSGETIYDVCKKYSKESDESEFVDDAIQKKAVGVYFSEPDIIYTDGGYKLENVRRVVAICNSAKLTEPFGKRTLIHELGHLIKSYNNEFIIEGDRLFERSGIITREYSLSVDEAGNVKRTLIHEKNVGLEEGINSYDEANIYSIYSEQERKYIGYATEAFFAENLSENLGLRKEILESQFVGDIQIIKSKYNNNLQTDEFDSLCMLVDDSVKLEYEMYNNMFLCISDKKEDKDKWESIIESKNQVAISAVENMNNAKLRIINSRKTYK